MLPLFAQGGPVHPLFVLVLALILDALLGDPPWLWRRLPHPVALIGRGIDWAERHLNRPARGAFDRRLRGALMAAVLVLAAIAIGLGVSALRLRTGWGWALEAVLASTLIAQNSLYRHVGRVAAALEEGGIVGGRSAVAMIVGRDTRALDEAGICRAAVESLAENFSDAVVAPVFWYVLFGFPGLLALKTVNTLDSMVGHKDERHLDFGMVSARLDDAMMWIPARLAGLLVVLAAFFVPRGRPGEAFLTMRRDHSRHASPNSAWPEAAMAGALGLALGGPRRYLGHVADEGWIGRGRASATVADIQAALALFSVACLLDGGMVTALLLLSL